MIFRHGGSAFLAASNSSASVKEGLVNDAKLTWNPDFWVEKNGKKILVAKAIDQM